MHSGTSGSHLPRVEHLAVAALCPLRRCCPAGHDAFTTVPVTVSAVETTRNTSGGHDTAAARNNHRPCELYFYLLSGLFVVTDGHGR